MLVFVSPVVAGSDFTSVNDEVIFSVGEYSKDITVPILQDSVTEADEVFTVDLATDCCANVSVGQVQVTITENDGDGK